MALPSVHPDFARFFQAIKTGGFLTAWSGQGFRASVPKWMSEPYRLTGLGAGVWGGRWNVAQLMTANYFSLDPGTAVLEAQAEAARNGWAPQLLRTHVQMAATVTLNQLLDLRQTATLTALGVAAADLKNCPWAADQAAGRESLTQAIARAVFENMGEGLLAPSAQINGGVNLVVLPLQSSS